MQRSNANKDDHRPGGTRDDRNRFNMILLHRTLMLPLGLRAVLL